MGACVDPRIDAAVGWVAGGDFRAMALDKGFSEAMLDRLIKAAPGLAEMINHYDPALAYAGAPPTAIAILNNRNDSAMSPDYPHAVYDRLEPLYSNYPDRLLLRFFETDEPTHQLTKENYWMGCDWLERFLVIEDLPNHVP